MNTGKCRDCQASIVWVKTLKGKNMPVNRQPDPELGNIELDSQRENVVRIYGNQAHAGIARSWGKDLFKSHFDDCPNATNRRRRRAA